MLKNESYIRTFLNHGHIVSDGDLGVCRNCYCRSDAPQASKICPKATMIHVEVMRREVALLMDTFGNGTSGKKIRRKVNQIYKRGLKQKIQEEADQRLKALNELVKPRPKWIHPRIWSWIQGIVFEDKVSL